MVAAVVHLATMMAIMVSREVLEVLHLLAPTALPLVVQVVFLLVRKLLRDSFWVEENASHQEILWLGLQVEQVATFLVILSGGEMAYQVWRVQVPIMYPEELQVLMDRQVLPLQLYLVGWVSLKSLVVESQGYLGYSAERVQGTKLLRMISLVEVVLDMVLEVVLVLFEETPIVLVEVTRVRFAELLSSLPAQQLLLSLSAAVALVQDTTPGAKMVLLVQREPVLELVVELVDTAALGVLRAPSASAAATTSCARAVAVQVAA